eukprot:Clim_evm28s55 gene=Clim_evmTU28s55
MKVTCLFATLAVAGQAVAGLEVSHYYPTFAVSGTGSFSGCKNAAEHSTLQSLFTSIATGSAKYKCNHESEDSPKAVVLFTQEGLRVTDYMNRENVPFKSFGSLVSEAGANSVQLSRLENQAVDASDTFFKVLKTRVSKQCTKQLNGSECSTDELTREGCETVYLTISLADEDRKASEATVDKVLGDLRTQYDRDYLVMLSGHSDTGTMRRQEDPSQGDDEYVYIFFTIPILSGLIVSFVCISILFYGIGMIMKMQSPTRFDDAKEQGWAVTGPEK